MSWLRCWKQEIFYCLIVMEAERCEKCINVKSGLEMLLNLIYICSHSACVK